ncbi:MAG: tetratricopeptide repeat protein [Anaerolineales bacterium]|nr:tetratricopeptide repeat protein [Anaerolineales bacterium]
MIETIDQALNEGDLRKAEVLIARHLRSESLPSETRAQILLRRAQTRLLGERPDDALEELQTVLAIQPGLAKQPAVKMLLGDIYFSRFMLAEFGFADRANTNMALQYYNDVFESHPHFEKIGWLHYQRGRIYLSEDRVDEAIEEFGNGLNYSNRPPTLHAYCYERLGFIHLFEKRDPQTAMTYFDKATHLYPSGNNAGWIVQLHILRSRALKELDNYEAALAAASQALNSIDPTAADYRRTLTEAHLAVGEVLALIPDREAEAIEHLVHFLQNSKRPLGVDVTWSRVYETLGDLSLKLERYEQAIESYQFSLQFNPYHPWEVNIHYQIARCYYRMRAYERVINAIDRMKEAAERESQVISDYRVYNVLANAYFGLEQYQQAAIAYRKALELAPPGASNLQKIKTYLRFSEELALN